MSRRAWAGLAAVALCACPAAGARAEPVAARTVDVASGTLRLKALLYPAVGKTRGDGHNALYLAPSQWQDDVFRFLDEHVKR